MCRLITDIRTKLIQVCVKGGTKWTGETVLKIMIYKFLLILHKISKQRRRLVLCFLITKARRSRRRRTVIFNRPQLFFCSTWNHSINIVNQTITLFTEKQYVCVNTVAIRQSRSVCFYYIDCTRIAKNLTVFKLSAVKRKLLKVILKSCSFLELNMRSYDQVRLITIIV